MALVVALSMFGLLVVAMQSASTDFETVSYTSFFSINSSSSAKQMLRDFNGDESRLFLNPVALRLDLNSSKLAADIQQAFSPALMLQNFDYKEKQVLSRLNDAWSNVTYPDERGQLCKVYAITRLSVDPGMAFQRTRCQPNEMYRGSDTNNQPLFSLQRYFELHNQIVSLFQQGKYTEALEVSYGPSNVVLGHALDGMEGVAHVNEKYFVTTQTPPLTPPQGGDRRRSLNRGDPC